MNIKQENMLIDDFHKLTDFYQYKLQPLKDYINLPMVGTCYYMSPEVFGKKEFFKIYKF